RTARELSQFTLEHVAVDLTPPDEPAPRIRRGEMVHSDPKESSEREMAAGLTYLVQQPLPEVLTAFRATVDLKADPHLSASVPIRGAGTPADFASVGLEPDGAEEAQRYLEARPGDTLNLSADDIQAFNALAAAPGDPKAKVEEQLRRMLLARYQAYLAKGLTRLAPHLPPP